MSFWYERYVSSFIIIIRIRPIAWYSQEAKPVTNAIIGACLESICNTENSCCLSSYLPSISTEIPFLSFGTHLQSSGSVASLMLFTAFQEIFPT